MLFLFATIIFVFAFNFGPWAGQAGGGPKPYAVKVNSKVVPLADFQLTFNEFRAPYANAQNGKELSEQQTSLIKINARDYLINQELLAQLATSNDLEVPKLELAKTIRDSFSAPGKEFSLQEYKRVLQENVGISEAAFERYLRRRILAGKMVDLLQTGVYIDETEVRAQFDLKNDKASVNFVQIDPRFFDAKTPSPNQVESWAKTHELEIARHYNDNLNDFRQSEQVQASHILFKVDKDAETKEREAAYKKAQDVLAQAKKPGTNFAELAKKHSQDGSAKKGGDLGFFGRGAMVKPFEEAAFSMEKGETSDIVESRFGYHIIQVTDTKAGFKKELPEAKLEIAKVLMEQDSQKKKALAYAQDILKDLKDGRSVNRLRAQGLVSEDTKDRAAYAPIRGKTRLFTPSDAYLAKIGSAEPLVTAAFGLKKTDDVLGKVLELNGKYVVAQLAERKKPDPKLYAKEKDKLMAGMLTRRKSQFTMEYLRYLRAQASVEYNEQLFGEQA